MNIGIIIQARTSSTRLPKKVLLKLPYNSKYTVLDQVIKRCKLSKFSNRVIVATTTDREDDKIINIAKKNKVYFFRGSKEDVLSRYYYAAKENKLDAIVRVTSDCPFVDCKIVDDLIELFLKNNCDYASNTLKRTYPHGLDCEVFSIDALEKSFKECKNIKFREHVTLYIYNNPKKFKIKLLEAPKKLNRPEIRITLDTEEDYALSCAVYDYLYKKGQYFDCGSVINLFNAKPWLFLINKKIAQKKIFKNIKDELEEAV
ncbi:MAG: acylneuraminate cytidylyltransferase, partial [Elusimicrobia bacterium]|nr:acylneuraminate cytidylyltransferase [Elusimicrobiota bacterium]